jgi:integrase
MARKDGKNRGIVEKPKGSRKWWVRLFENGREKWYRVDNKTQAKALYGKLKGEIRDEIYFPEKYKPKRQSTLREIIDARMDGYTGRNLKNEQHHSRWWKHLWGASRVKELTADDFRKLQVRLLDKGKKAPATVDRLFEHARAAFNLAVQSGKIDKSPMAGVKLFRRPNARLRFLSEGEETRLKEVMAPHHFRVVRFALLTGLRRGEQFRIRWECADLENRVLTIPLSKSGKTRHITLSDEAAEILRSLPSWMTSSWMFPSENPATPMDAQNFYNRVFRPALKSAKIEDTDWHTLRHTFASRLVMAGVDLRTVAELLGHSTIQMTMRYAHLSPRHLREAVNRLSVSEDLEIGVGTGSKTGSEKDRESGRIT